MICGVFQVEVDDLLGIGDDQQQQQQYPAQPVQAQGDSYDYSGAMVPAGGGQSILDIISLLPYVSYFERQRPRVRVTDRAPVHDVVPFGHP